MPLATGTRLGPYEITAPLGAGGMGEVYKAHDTRLDRDVAIKVLPARLAGDPDFRDRFDREARAISRLNHAHICTIHDLGHHDGTAYLVMEYLEGETLGQWLRRSPAPSIDAIVAVAMQTAEALHAAHGSGIVHRDIKPDNVIVRQDGVAKVLDFGVAKMAVASGPDAMGGTSAETLPGFIVGTTQYMSPEQARGLAVDARSDLFSLGAMLYEMLTRRPPFEGATASDTIVAILERQPAPLVQHRHGLPGALQDIVSRCLEKDAARRYSSARELIADLERARADIAVPQPPARATPSIAVLPFVNMSNDPENEYFCDGVAEDLISALTKIEQLHVAARTSAFSFKGRNADLKEIGRALNVTTVLEGSVRKSGNRLRVTAQLVNVADGYQLWSERYDRQLEDVFEIQDEISLAIVKALRVRLLGEEKVAVVKRQTDNIEAYQLYLKGRHHWHKWNADEFAKSKTCMERAIALDPDYALAYFGLADVYLASGAIGVLSYRELLPTAKATVKKALDLAPDLAEAWALMGVVGFYEWDWQASERASTRAIELNPRLGHAYLVRALNAYYSGRYESALPDSERAVELDPLSPLWHLSIVNAHIARRDYEGATRCADALVDLDSTFWWGHNLQGQLAVIRGRFDEAARHFSEAIRHSGGAPYAVGLHACALGLSGERVRAEQELARLLDMAGNHHVPAISVAIAYAGLGRVDESFEWLYRSLEERDIWMIGEVLYLSELDALRGDPRMTELRRRFAQAGVRLEQE